MQITAAMVKELRERTGAGMMECKKALAESDGQMEAAIELMRKSGQAKADKKAGRVAAEGAVVALVSEDSKSGVILEVNCETDFVAKDNQFLDFCQAVAVAVLTQRPDSLDALKHLKLSDGREVEEARLELFSKIGENLQVRRFQLMAADSGVLGTYMHGNRIGVMVKADTSAEAEVLRDVAMHIAASRPLCVDESGIDPEVLAKEKEIFSAQAAASGKPADIIEKMVQGRIKKFIGEVTLLGQPFVKDPDTTVGKWLDAQSAKISMFVRFEVGEGIEKKSENFADEVMKQVQGS